MVHFPSEAGSILSCGVAFFIVPGSAALQLYLWAMETYQNSYHINLWPATSGAWVQMSIMAEWS